MPNSVRIHYDCTDLQYDHLPVDFYHVPDEIEGSKGSPIQLLHVQLYTEGR